MSATQTFGVPGIQHTHSPKHCNILRDVLQFVVTQVHCRNEIGAGVEVWDSILV